MKVLKYIIIGLGLIVFIYISLGFIYFMSLPSPPKETIKIADKYWNIEEEFPGFNKEHWGKFDDKLTFSNKTGKKELIKLNSVSIPSEMKKKGYITTSVITSGSLGLIPDDCILGIQIGEGNSNEENQILMGINGKSEIVILDGNLEKLNNVKIRHGRSREKENETKLSFHYYRNPYGWVIFFSAKFGDKYGHATINYIPYETLDSKNKEIALVVYNPTQKGDIWFKEWKIQNDWTPND